MLNVSRHYKNTSLKFCQTRLSDWKEGGINSKFMLSKLKSSAVALQEYEKSAAPDGWKVVWDRCV